MITSFAEENMKEFVRIEKLTWHFALHVSHGYYVLRIKEPCPFWKVLLEWDGKTICNIDNPTVDIP